ncbi:MAG: S8 family serine peptidase [Candidatus Bipolaricaulaceae bacterium]
MAVVGRIKRLLWIGALLALVVGLPGSGPEPAGGAGGYVLPPGVRPSWSLSAVHAPEAWRVTQGTDQVVVAVIDSGIDCRVPALRGRMWHNPGEIPGNRRDDDGNGYVDDVHGWDFRDGDASSLSGTPIHEHGTFVAGLVAAALDANSGAGGVAPGVRIMDLRFLDRRGLFYRSDWGRLVAAIDYAVAQGADVINLSIYAKLTPPAAVHAAIRRAAARGILVVGIAGNDGGKVGYFGRYPEVLTVAAVDRNARVAGFSNRGPEVDLAGPGVEVLSYEPGGRQVTGSGTSFAAPHVAGAAALILSVNPDIRPEQLRELLRESAADLGPRGHDETTGYGLVDAAAAVQAAAAR